MPGAIITEYGVQGSAAMGAGAFWAFPVGRALSPPKIHPFWFMRRALTLRFGVSQILYLIHKPRFFPLWDRRAS